METAVFDIDGSWQVPPGVTEYTIECIQAGSAGDGGISLGAGAGGGAEGTYARKKVTNAVPGTVHNIIVGQQTGVGAYSTNAPGPTGDASIFYAGDGSTELCAARGGVGAGQGGTVNSSRFGGTAATTGSVGDSLQAGVSGDTAATGAGSSGGNGGGATPITDSPTGLVRGAGGLGGITADVTGKDGSSPGGAGGGGKGAGGATATGGRGARGIVVVSWTSRIRWS